MIKVLIIEDEIPARNKLRRFIKDLQTPVEIVNEFDTVQGSIDFLLRSQVDVIFSDIELLDGNAFEVYRRIPVKSPIIFTTAYDKFLMSAFESNGIDYLLKPFTKERFQKAWNKFISFGFQNSQEFNIVAKLQQLLEIDSRFTPYKKRFTVNNLKEIYFLEVDDIAFFEAEQGVVFAYDSLNKKHLLNETTLIELENQLNPLNFFRVNRSELVNKKYIEKIERYSKNDLAVKLKNLETSLKTSQSNTASFREWIKK